MLAFSVSTRIPEIGIRMSLGADASRVRRMVLGEGGVLLVTGLVLGFAGALVAVRVLRGMLFGVAPNDPATLVGVAVLLAAVGVIACWLPAARAAASIRRWRCALNDPGAAGSGRRVHIGTQLIAKQLTAKAIRKKGGQRPMVAAPFRLADSFSCWL